MSRSSSLPLSSPESRPFHRQSPPPIPPFSGADDSGWQAWHTYLGPGPSAPSTDVTADAEDVPRTFTPEWARACSEDDTDPQSSAHAPPFPALLHNNINNFTGTHVVSLSRGVDAEDAPHTRICTRLGAGVGDLRGVVLNVWLVGSGVFRKGKEWRVPNVNGAAGVLHWDSVFSIRFGSTLLRNASAVFSSSAFGVVFFIHSRVDSVILGIIRSGSGFTLLSDALSPSTLFNS
ncbi:hypothetical protein B0H11DRAFT_1922328 [Mycena galericulata]|nr:hypothetical protein B0H11DRAFT_1922328 [Mycena galericulata]